MGWTSVFFNPTFRGNVLQLLLLSLTLPVNLAITSFSTSNLNASSSLRSLILTIGIAFFILLHHVASLFLSRLSGVVVVDWLLLVFEIAGVSFTIFRVSGLPSRLLALPTLIALIVMLCFRTATVLASPDRLWEQKLEFWGGCRATHRSPWMVLLNRPLGKPLVRGESMFAIVVRCVILVLIGIALPVLAVNKIFFQPSRASVYSRVIASQYSAANPAFQFEINGNVVLIMPQSNEYPMSMSVTATSSSTPFHCNTYGMTLSNPPMPSHAIENRFTIATCPLSWAEINSIDVSITFSQLGGAPYGIYPGVGDFNDIVMFTQPIPVLAAFNLFAYMTWTSRQLVFTHSGFLSLFNTLLPGRNVQHMEIYSLFPVPGSGPITTTSTPSAFDLSESTTTVNMTIVQRESFVTKFVQEFTDATALDGLSSMGGLWTTIDAIFTILFGASVLYFAFGKRPLSPLGIVHTFQNRTLTRNWHEDFPAIRTEGGEPGSDNAGVVAFLRDRWLDIAEEDDRDAPGRNKEGELVAPWV